MKFVRSLSPQPLSNRVADAFRLGVRGLLLPAFALELRHQLRAPVLQALRARRLAGEVARLARVRGEVEELLPPVPETNVPSGRRNPPARAI